jgi:hypothetical protein
MVMIIKIFLATLLLALPALAQIAPPPLDDYQAVGISRDGSQGMLVNLKDVSVEGHVVGFVTILAGIKGRDTNGTYVFNPKQFVVNQTRYNCDTGEYWVLARHGFWNGVEVSEKYDTPTKLKLDKDSALKWAGERACTAKFGVQV